MTDREQMDYEMENEDGEWRRLNVRQANDMAWAEFAALVASLAGCVAFWEAFAWVLKIARMHFHV